MDTVKSADGTIIAYDQVGDGPPLIVSVGAFCTRRTFVPPDDLSARFTVYTYDRRGRGDSGDTQPYAPEREYEDLAAVASVCARPPYVFGHSSGAVIVLRAAARGVPMAALVAYEAPFTNDQTPPPPPDPAAHITTLVAAGRRGEAVEFWMRDVVHMPAEAVAGMKSMPWFKAMEPLTPTLPYDIAVTDGGVPAAELAAITVPVLVLGGGNSPAWFQRSVADQAAAIAGGRLQTIAGYDHNAPPEIIASILLDFFR
jgi:pimeloyl-ACP methyl ester carboxylesterase